MTAIRHLADVMRLAVRAMSSGGERISFSTVRWNIAGNCTDPYLTEVKGRPRVEGRKTVVVGRGLGHVMHVDIYTRCRKCAACKRVRMNLWYHRARAEFGVAARVWFGTVTLRPEAYLRFLNEARRTEAINGVEFDFLGDEERFALIHAKISRELTLMLKRVRQATGAPFKYLLVAEQHKSGVPHYHLLVYEQSATSPVTWAVLDANWPHGYSKWKLVTDKATATYVVKYVGKSNLARVRASLHFGEVSASSLHSLLRRGNIDPEKGGENIRERPSKGSSRSPLF